MPIVKRVKTSSTIAWNASLNDPYLLICGNVSGTLDDSFQTSSRMELYSMDPRLNGTDPQLVSEVAVQEANFSHIAWGDKGISDGSHEDGIIAAGMSDGSVLLWDAHQVINAKDDIKPITKVQKHQQCVLDIEFHPMQSNLMASCSAGGEMLIWDMQSIEQPIVTSPAPTSRSGPGLTALSWNSKVGHILATTNAVGQTSVWDLRQKRAVITFNESSYSQVAATSVVWDPLQAKQLVVTYNNPTPELWDLRNSMSPKGYFDGVHTKGVLSGSFCPHDPEIFATSGDDQITAFWTHDGTLLHSEEGQGSNFQSLWNPHVPGLMASSSRSGDVSVSTVNYTGLSHVPRWIMQPCGAAFGFGDRIVQPTASKTQLSISRVSPEEAFIKASHEFQQSIEAKEPEEICQERIDMAEDDDEYSVWSFINVMFSDDPRKELLSKLGYTPSEDHTAAFGDPVLEAVKEKPDEVDDESFFDNISNKSPPKAAAVVSTSTLSKELPIEPEDETDAIIKQHVLSGDLRRAVAACFDAKRSADALLISSLGSPELWAQTKEAYVKQHPKGYMRHLVGSVMNKSIGTYVEQSDLDQWKETLAMINTYTSDEETRMLSNVLADRLHVIGNNTASAVCFIAAYNVDRAVALWLDSEVSEIPPLRLQKAITKLFVYTQAAQRKNESMSSLTAYYFSEYAGLLVSQGLISEALRFLQVACGSESYLSTHETAVLADRIYNANAEQYTDTPPSFPFNVEYIGASTPQESSQPLHRRRSSGMNQPAPQRPLPAASQHAPPSARRTPMQRGRAMPQRQAPARRTPMAARRPMPQRPSMQTRQPPAARRAAAQRTMRAPAPARPGRPMPTSQSPLPMVRRTPTIQPRGPVPTAGRPQRPMPSRPAAQRPAASRPVAQRPAASRPVAQRPAASRPVAQRPAASRPVAQRPAASRPVAQRPAASRPVAQRPVASRPVAQRPAASQPVSHSPAPQRPAARQPMPHRPTAEPQPLPGPPVATQLSMPQRPSPARPTAARLPMPQRPAAAQRPSPQRPSPGQPPASVRHPIPQRASPAQPVAQRPIPQPASPAQPAAARQPMPQRSAPQAARRPGAPAARPLGRPVQRGPARRMPPASRRTPQRGAPARQPAPAKTLELEVPVLEGEVAARCAAMTSVLTDLVSQIGSQSLSSVDAKMVEDFNKRAGVLYSQVSDGTVSDATIQAVTELSGHILSGEFNDAGKVRVRLIQESWDEVREWLPGFKSMIALGKKYNAQ